MHRGATGTRSTAPMRSSTHYVTECSQWPHDGVRAEVGPPAGLGSLALPGRWLGRMDDRRPCQNRRDVLPAPGDPVAGESFQSRARPAAASLRFAPRRPLTAIFSDKIRQLRGDGRSDGEVGSCPDLPQTCTIGDDLAYAWPERAHAGCGHFHAMRVPRTASVQVSGIAW